MRGGGVIHVAMRHGPNDRELISPLGKQRKVLANLDSGSVGRNRLELTSHFAGSVGFEVPGVLMSGTSPHEQQNARLGFAKHAR